MLGEMEDAHQLLNSSGEHHTIDVKKQKQRLEKELSHVKASGAGAHAPAVVDAATKLKSHLEVTA